MAHVLSAAEANRTFSAVLRVVRAGKSVTVTSHGRPVARIVPVRAGDQITNTAWRMLLKRLKAAQVSDVGRWTRDELHGRDRPRE